MAIFIENLGAPLKTDATVLNFVFDVILQIHLQLSFKFIMSYVIYQKDFF